jgi:N-methylhydantoinase B
MPGAGGWGDPLERDPRSVLEDILDEKLSEEYCEREYGVVIDGASLSIDLKATMDLRDRIRSIRAT